MMTICVGASGPPAVAAPNSFSATGSLHTARYVYNQDLIRLCDGRQLIAGGSVPGASTATAEIYDPATGVWTVVASMREARSSHSATLLSDCRVLVDNGGATTLGSAEIYNPVTNIWTTVGSLGVGRYNPTAFRLPSGKVLVAGGGVPGSGDTVATSSAELFDPATGTWSPTGSLNTPRMNQSGAQFLDGRVVVSGGMPHGGGYSGGGFDTAEIYDPATEVWTYTGNTMATGRRGFHSMTTLPSGQVLVAGGHVTSGGDPTSSAELLDPASTLWTPTASMPSGRFFHSATVLRGGTVLIAGGLVGSTYLDDAYIFDPSDPTWTAVTSHLGEVRALHQAALLDNGKVLIAGGWNGTNELATSELYSPVWSVRGFYEPVDMRSAGHPITVNRVKSGATVPFKFEVFAGATELTSVAVVASIVGTNVTCTPGAEQDVERIPLTMHGSSRLRYDRGDGHFIFKWQTPSHSTGKCYRIDMTTQDGSSLSAFFKLK